MKISTNIGYLFEVAFNIGILSFLLEKLNDKSSHINGNKTILQEYKEHLSKYNLKSVEEYFEKSVIDKTYIETQRKYIPYLLFKGKEAGYNFARELTNAIRERVFDDIHLHYYQCNLLGLFGTTPSENENEFYKRIIKTQLGINEEDIDYFKETGEFLKADVILYFYRETKNGKVHRVIVIDTSMYMRNIIDITNLTQVKQSLIKDINERISKSCFSNLSIDSEGIMFEFSEKLNNYLNAFNSKDKSSMKVIQAGSYGYSFYNYLLRKEIAKPNENIVINVIGYTDKDIGAISINNKTLDVAKSCYSIYKNKINDDNDNLRDNILNIIKINTLFTFEDAKGFINKITNPQNEGINIFTHNETIKDFTSTAESFTKEQIINDWKLQMSNIEDNMNFRDIHKQVVIDALEDKAIKLLFLVGSAGIGKTTSIAEYLKAHQCEGFLFFYVSPRKQVNIDVKSKFSNTDFFYLTANYIDSNLGYDIVRYESNISNIENIVNSELSRSPLKYRKLDEVVERRCGGKYEFTSEKDISEKERRTKGVLKRVCSAVNELLEKNITNKIIATASIQSLQKIGTSEDTSKNIKLIFDRAIDGDNRKVRKEEAEKLSNKVKNIVFMIDEITGDESGVEFFLKVLKFFNIYNLWEYFNIKLVVADASIVGKNVIKKHLSSEKPEWNKIYFDSVSDSVLPITKEDFQYNNKQSVVINANSYPAKELNIEYKVYQEIIPKDNDSDLHITNKLLKEIDKSITKDILEFVKKNPERQLIVYIQDRSRLFELIEDVKSKEKFEKFKDYLEIHSSIPQWEREKIEEVKDSVKVIFMTASASRGLSFEKVVKIIIDIPKFEIEKNIMEVLQVIYRGRGNKDIDRNENKSLVFYLSDKIFYDPKNKERDIRENSLSLLNILIILKSSLMTRIKGYCRIGKNKFIVVPVGGKSISAVGDIFSEKLSQLSKDIGNELRKNRNDKNLIQIKEMINNVFSYLNIQFKKQQVFIRSIEKIKAEFIELANRGFDKIIDYKPINECFIIGDFAFFRINEQIGDVNRILYSEVVRYVEKNNIRETIQTVISNSKYQETIREYLKDIYEILDKSYNAKDESSKELLDESSSAENYICIPLYIPFNFDEFKGFYRCYEEEEYSFKDLINCYTKAYYSIGNTIPIDNKFERFPFIFFKSYSLSQIREKIFKDSYLFSSNELNILNLILSEG